MTEAEWVACIDPLPMLDHLQGTASRRKLRLFAVACGRTWPPPADARSRRAAEVAGRYADGQATAGELAAAFADARAAVAGSDPAAACAHAAAHPDPWVAARSAAEAACGPRAALLRDLFGNPFRPAALDPSLLTPEVVALARAVYADEDFGRLPELGDALERAGCADAGLLRHCHEPGPHARGCWLLDLVLGNA
jgi:hypothetical protein